MIERTKAVEAAKEARLPQTPAAEGDEEADHEDLIGEGRLESEEQMMDEEEEEEEDEDEEDEGVVEDRFVDLEEDLANVLADVHDLG